MATGALTQANADTFTISTLVTQVREGRVRVPSFQRPLRWKRDDVRRLFDSVLKGYPIGSLLLWKRPAAAERISVGSLTIDAPELDEALWVVDGQQRLTSLANALTEAGAKDPFALAYDLETHSLVESRRDRPHLVPLHLLFDLPELLKWFARNPDESAHLDEAVRVASLLKEYRVPVYVVAQDDESVLRDIFDRMNTFGKRLSRAEVFDALHSTSRSDRLADVAERVHARTGFGVFDENTLLLCSLARRGTNLGRDFREELPRLSDGTLDGAAITKANRATEDAIVAAVRFLQRECHVPHLTFLPYAYLVVVLTRFFALHPEPQPRNVDLLRRFTWRAALAGPRIARGAYTGTLGMLVGRVGDDESGAVQKLLATAARDDQLFELRSLPKRFSPKLAEARFVLCAMWRNGPRSFSNGERYDPSELAEALAGRKTASDALTLLDPGAKDAKLRIENRLLCLDPEPPALAGLDSKAFHDVLVSHVLPPVIGAPEEVLAYRRDALLGLTRRFLNAMAETTMEDTPPLSDLTDDEDEDEDEDDALIDVDMYLDQARTHGE